MICNIIDCRRHSYRWKSVNAVVEATSHDNSLSEADHAPEDDGVEYEQREGISVEAAIAWANAFTSPVTLFLYDEGDGTPPR